MKRIFEIYTIIRRLYKLEYSLTIQAMTSGFSFPQQRSHSVEFSPQDLVLCLKFINSAFYGGKFIPSTALCLAQGCALWWSYRRVPPSFSSCIWPQRPCFSRVWSSASRQVVGLQWVRLCLCLFPCRGWHLSLHCWLSEWSPAHCSCSAEIDSYRGMWVHSRASLWRMK